MELLDQLTVSLKKLIEPITPYIIQFWDLFQDHAYLRAALIAAAAYFLSKFIAHYIPLALDKLMQTFYRPVSVDLLKLIKFPLFYLSFFGGLIVAVKLSGFSLSVTSVLVSILKSLLIAVLTISIYRAFIYSLENIAKNSKNGSFIQPQTLPLFTNSALVLFILAAIHQIFSVWNVDMTALLASAGIAGLAIGMASKDTLSDVIAGVLILTDKPYKLGDFIHLDNGTKGTVTHIGIRSTRIKTKDNVEIIVPNSMMGNSEVANESSVSHQQGIRIKLDIRTAYGVDVLHIREIILAVVSDDEGIMQDKKNVVVLAEFDERFMTFRLMYWIDAPINRASSMSRLREGIYNQFQRQNIDIALPAKQSIAISEQPDIQQQIAITSLPDLKQEISISQMPNIFGTGTAKNIGTNKSTNGNANKITVARSASITDTPPQPSAKDEI